MSQSSAMKLFVNTPRTYVRNPTEKKVKIKKDTAVPTRAPPLYSAR